MELSSFIYIFAGLFVLFLLGQLVTARAGGDRLSNSWIEAVVIVALVVWIGSLMV